MSSESIAQFVFSLCDRQKSGSIVCWKAMIPLSCHVVRECNVRFRSRYLALGFIVWPNPDQISHLIVISFMSTQLHHHTVDSKRNKKRNTKLLSTIVKFIIIYFFSATDVSRNCSAMLILCTAIHVYTKQTFQVNHYDDFIIWFQICPRNSNL